MKEERIKKHIFAFDFSMIKPAMCTLINDKVNFYIWPAHIDEPTETMLSECNINIINRGLPEMHAKELDESELICEHVRRSNNLADIIVKTIKNILDENHIDNLDDVLIANEGFAFNAKGNATLDLSGYKYILMTKLIEAGFTHFKTYSPISLKSTAGCSKKGKGEKKDMISSLSEEPQELHTIIYVLANSPQSIKKRKAYIDCIDDIADSYWCMRTAVIKENIECIFNNG